MITLLKLIISLICYLYFFKSLLYSSKFLLISISNIFISFLNNYKLTSYFYIFNLIYCDLFYIYTERNIYCYCNYFIHIFIGYVYYNILLDKLVDIFYHFYYIILFIYYYGIIICGGFDCIYYVFYNIY